METREMTFTDWLGKENDLGLRIMENKYRKNSESFPEWLHRVSGGDPELKQLILEKKILLGGRTMSNRGTDSPASYFNCLTGDTKIFTSEGIKPIGELSGKTVNVLTNGFWKPAEIKCFGEQDVCMLHLKRSGQSKTIGTTANHIWLVGKRNAGYSKVTTDKLVPGMQLAYSTARCYRKYKPSPFGVAHGFHFGDGDHVEKKNIRTNICKGKEELLPYFMPDTVTAYKDTLIVNGVPYFFNQKPRLDESPSYLYGWLAGYFAADGSVSQSGQCVICSTVRDNLETVRDVLCVLGLPAGIIRSQQRISNLTGEMGTVYILSLNRFYLNESFFILAKHRERYLNTSTEEPKPWIVESVSDIIGREPVYCAVVPDTHTFTLDNNILTHNCYSRGFVEDSYKDIMQVAVDIGLTFKGEGGQGISLTKLRPYGTAVGKNYTSDGIVPFMRIYNEVTAGTSQGGSRKGALMLSIDARHKEAKTFIHIKSEEGQIEKANLSLEIDDEFMEAVRKYYKTGEVVTLHEKHNYSGHMVEYDVVPIEIFKALVDNCYDWADPAALFVNRLRNYNLMQYDNDYQIETTNPCGEQPLPKHGACCLASLNMSAFVKNPYTDKAYFSTDEFAEAVKVGIRTLDKLIDENYYRHPLKEQQEMSYNYCGKEMFVIPARYNSAENIYCNVDCMAKHYSQLYTGENSPTWTGGKSHYTGGWLHAREEARKRDNYTCAICGITEKEFGQELSVHHIKKYKDFDDKYEANLLNNLISLCENCHRFVHSNKNVNKLYINT